MYASDLKLMAGAGGSLLNKEWWMPTARTCCGHDDNFCMLLQSHFPMSTLWEKVKKNDLSQFSQKHTLSTFWMSASSNLYLTYSSSPLPFAWWQMRHKVIYTGTRSRTSAHALPSLLWVIRDIAIWYSITGKGELRRFLEL